MNDDLELTPRFRLVERIQLLEQTIRSLGSEADQALTRAERAVEQLRATGRAHVDKELKKLVKIGLLGKDQPRRGRPPKKKRFMSAEARAKISEAKKAYWAAKKAGKIK